MKSAFNFDKMKVEGFITAVLTNAKTGKIAKKITQKNRVSPEAFLQMMSGVIFWNNQAPQNSQANDNAFGMWLTDSDVADGHLIYLHGNILGYAATTKDPIPQGTAQGSCIWQEPKIMASYDSNGNVTFKRRFCWNGNQANGTIKTISTGQIFRDVIGVGGRLPAIDFANNELWTVNNQYHRVSAGDTVLFCLGQDARKGMMFDGVNGTVQTMASKFGDIGSPCQIGLGYRVGSVIPEVLGGSVFCFDNFSKTLYQLNANSEDPNFKSFISPSMILNTYNISYWPFTDMVDIPVFMYYGNAYYINGSSSNAGDKSHCNNYGEFYIWTYDYIHNTPPTLYYSFTTTNDIVSKLTCGIRTNRILDSMFGSAAFKNNEMYYTTFGSNRELPNVDRYKLSIKLSIVNGNIEVGTCPFFSNHANEANVTSSISIPFKESILNYGHASSLRNSIFSGLATQLVLDEPIVKDSDHILTIDYSWKTNL
jgi:hypothetical protein